jgi:hypothetical protein
LASAAAWLSSQYFAISADVGTGGPTGVLLDDGGTVVGLVPAGGAVVTGGVVAGGGVVVVVVGGGVVVGGVVVAGGAELLLGGASDVEVGCAIAGPARPVTSTVTLTTTRKPRMCATLPGNERTPDCVTLRRQFRVRPR